MPINGGSAMIVFFVQSLKKLPISSKVQQEASVLPGDGVLHGSGRALAWAIGKAVHNGKNRRKLMAAIHSARYMAGRRAPSENSGNRP